MQTLETLAQGGAGNGFIDFENAGADGGQSPRPLQNSMIAPDFSKHETYQRQDKRLIECVAVIALVGEAENTNLN
jgi:hypothetical protein